MRKKVIKKSHSTTESSTRTAQISRYSWQKTHFRILSKIRPAIQKILGYPSRGGENALGTFATGSGTGRRSCKRGGGKIIRHSARVPHRKTSLMSPGYIMFRIISSASATLNQKMSWKSRLHSRLLSPPRGRVPWTQTLKVPFAENAKLSKIPFVNSGLGHRLQLALPSKCPPSPFTIQLKFSKLSPNKVTRTSHQQRVNLSFVNE